MSTLFLDDDQDRIATFLDDAPQGSVVVQTAAACIATIDANPILHDVISLDFTLGGHRDRNAPGTGMDVVEHIVINYTPTTLPVQIVIHSWNRPNAIAMVDALTSAGFVAENIPFVWDTPAHRARFLAKSKMTEQQLQEIKAGIGGQT